MILVKRGLAGGGEPQSVFDEYVKCLLNALNLTLENKNHKYEHNCERWLFMMNNYHFIKERLLDGHKDQDPVVNYDSQEAHAREEYLSIWNALRDHCLVEIKIQNSSKLSDKEKAAIKDKLKKFNNRFENLIVLNRQVFKIVFEPIFSSFELQNLKIDRV